MNVAAMIAPWRLTPEGGLVHPGERLAVVADVHLGYEWARGRGGDCVPAHSLAETLEKLECLLARTPVERLVVAGDLVESSRPCRRTGADVVALTHWLAGRGVALIRLAGNHDPRRRPPLPETLDVDGWTIAHGHRPIERRRGRRTITGHDHPVLRAGGASAPCFLVGRGAIVLPAFSPNAAGCNVAGGDVPEAWTSRSPSLRCVVAGAGQGGTDTDPEWLDFGPVRELRLRLNGRQTVAVAGASWQTETHRVGSVRRPGRTSRPSSRRGGGQK
jgi:putative SbcD/Mre11-related phosphoesterase